jgi:hypothetical protein
MSGPFNWEIVMKRKIKFNGNAYINGELIAKKGDVLELEGASADRWLKRGHVEYKEDEEQAEIEVEAEPVKKKKKKVSKKKAKKSEEVKDEAPVEDAF